MSELASELETWPYRDAIDVMVSYHRGLRAELTRLRAIDNDVLIRDPESIQDAAHLAAEAIDLIGREGQLHAFDEDGVLFPRLREAVGTGDSGLREALERIDAEHVALMPLWPRLERCLAGLCVPDEPVSLRDLHDARLELEALVIPHMHFEERFVYPAARRLLGPTEMRDMMYAMRAHRGRPSEGGFSPLP